MTLLAAYRATGADLPYGDPGRAHGVAMEGYFWRITDRAADRVVIALIGVNQAPDRSWATLGLGAHPGGFLTTAEHPGATAAPDRLAASAGVAFVADTDQVRVDLGRDSRLQLTISDGQLWPRSRFGGSSWFQSVPGLNQYWHPWLLSGRADGYAVLGDETWDFTGAEVYAEKNWGREGFPDAWWWGQAHGFDEPGVTVAFAGGQVRAGPVQTEVTALVVRLPDGTVLRLGNPVTSPVRAEVSDERWRLVGVGRRLGRDWRVEVTARAPLANAHILPVPLPSQGRNTPGALEHLAGELSVTVRRGTKVCWRGHTRLAGLEHGGLERAAAEADRRGGPV